MATRIYGYTDRISVKPGETLQFMVSAEGTKSVEAKLVRLIHGDENPLGPGFVEQEIDSVINRSWPARYQFAQKGNFLRVHDPAQRLACRANLTLHAYIYPTAPDHAQMIMGRWSANRGAGFGLGIDENGFLVASLGDGKKHVAIAGERPLVRQLWYFVAASFDLTSGSLTLYQRPVINRYNSLLSKIVPDIDECHSTTRVPFAPVDFDDVPFIIGGAASHSEQNGAHVAMCFSGKIDRCGVQNGATDLASLKAMSGGEVNKETAIAYWDTSLGYGETGIGDAVIDVGPHALHATGVNCPVRAQTGWNWSGRTDWFKNAPHEYGGIEFHEDALTDCRWEPTFELTVPLDLKSGVYAAKLKAGPDGAEEHLPFFVRALKPKAPICFLVPTATYLAYANSQAALESSSNQAALAVLPILQQWDMDAGATANQFGLSLYDSHNDGVGVCYSSYRRPISSLRPKYRLLGVGTIWGFPSDLSITAWLDHMGYDWELITDEDLHREGVDALTPYRVVINGTHCEYFSERMMDAVEDYLAAGGRLTYLSGNGYYWVSGFREAEPWIMEVRRLDGGTRAWQARAGEHYLATTGERGGLWRHRNRAPQKLVGTGFTAAGMDLSVPYRRMPDSYEQSLAWIFTSVKGEVFGDSGLALGGAAGLEIDRYDLTLGTPPHTMLLACSEPLSDGYPLVQEDIYFTRRGLGGTEDPRIRADMVYFTTRNDGAVFSASSIAWGSALPINGFANDVSTIMKNVIDAFIRPGPLPGSRKK